MPKRTKQGRFYVVVPSDDEYPTYMVESYWDGFNADFGPEGYWQEMIRRNVSFEDNYLLGVWELLFAMNVYNGNYEEFKKDMERFIKYSD